MVYSEVVTKPKPELRKTAKSTLDTLTNYS